MSGVHDGGRRCWKKRDTSGARAGPGSNIFAGALVTTPSGPTGPLQLQVAKSSTKWRCSEVIAPASLGYGDYVFVVASDPSAVDTNLVFAPFIYANDTAEIDIEFSKWGSATNAQNSQYVLQPYNLAGATWRYNMPTGSTFSTHRIRWAGPDGPAQVYWESWLSDGTLVASHAAAGGYNFQPGAEAVHINFWIYAGGRPSNSATATASLACFAFCPIDPATGAGGCSAAGAKPPCTNGATTWA